ncbi:MAG TPA: YggS family pyridoxal phosphate-dependent enzyme [Chloroflexota bacterium]|nr:YggS family pyridoxal phosphate-dependent enzyme [Chloroflexota bacterium]
MSTAAAPPPVAARLAAVRDQIDQAAHRARRRPGDVTLVAVSKTFGPDAVRDVLDGGVTDLGENRVQEAEEKVPAVGRPARWHLIGHLQSNKINKALELFDLIQSVDSLDLARSIGQRANKRGAPAPVLLQVNVAGKESQFGFSEDELRAAAAELAGLEGLSLNGLMCIAPLVDNPEETRPTFRRLAQLGRDLEKRFRDAGHAWRHLSMGMSNDFQVAIEEGATLVRVGRAIFGERG